MATSSVVYARIDHGLKEKAEKILSSLGITPSGAVQMFYSKIVMTQGIPFDLHLENKLPVAVGGLSREQLNEEIVKGIKSIRSGFLYSAKDLDTEFERMYGV